MESEFNVGRVCLAEQHEPVQRRVALKLIKRGLDSKQVLKRFEAERQALARMEHDSIAKVFDAGTSETGQPYFVMEYVSAREIGVRMSVGARARDVGAQFFAEALTLALTGGLLGIVLGGALSWTLRSSLGWAMEISLGAVALGFAVATAIGLLSGVVPARRASALDPINALRYE